LPSEAADKPLARAAKAGVSREALKRAAGWDGGAEIAFGDLCAMYEQAARLTGDGAFGIHVGEETSPRQYGLLGYAADNCGLLGEALDLITQLQSIWTDTAGIELRSARNTVTCRYWHRGDIAPEQRRQESEEMLTTLLRFVQGLLDLPLRPLEIRFEHEAPVDLTEHHRVFGSALVFSAPATELVLPRDWLAKPIVRSDLVLGQLIRSQAEEILRSRPRTADLVDRLQALILERFLNGSDLTLREASAAIGLGTRSLQRALAERDLTYRAMVDQQRIHAARRLLADRHLGLAEIAHQLGFSQVSAFHRAFRRVTGTTPRAFRLNLRR
jgi:AraC-like DNA-binding protein